LELKKEYHMSLPAAHMDGWQSGLRSFYNWADKKWQPIIGKQNNDPILPVGFLVMQF
jgi:hypothetical protein